MDMGPNITIRGWYELPGRQRRPSNARSPTQSWKLLQLASCEWPTIWPCDVSRGSEATTANLGCLAWLLDAYHRHLKVSLAQLGPRRRPSTEAWAFVGQYGLTSTGLTAKAGGIHAAPRGDRLLFARFTTLAVTKRVMNSTHTGRLALGLAYSKLDKKASYAARSAIAALGLTESESSLWSRVGYGLIVYKTDRAEIRDSPKMYTRGRRLADYLPFKMSGDMGGRIQRLRGFMVV
ncbi:hypothetical protein NPX13_g5676 [Xylaria arbuscula]|uniref:Uncharacterized protein n=1 Tax=Xylaria arbuscula TaxID=114810 RepID=A0A9W8NDZ9_9PEZI|nr:hypothetical protein NPX13_g5676 [Xylaria arbuscula]